MIMYMSVKEFENDKLRNDAIVDAIKMQVGSLRNWNTSENIDYEWRVKHQDEEGVVLSIS